jgi:hypothetical protein
LTQVEKAQNQKIHSLYARIAGLTAVTFLIEGAILAWSAWLIPPKDIAPASQGGVGTMLFSAATTAGRLPGDAIEGGGEVGEDFSRAVRP